MGEVSAGLVGTAEGGDVGQDTALFGETTGTSERPAAPLALYRRYRPDTYAEVIGQEHVTEPLQRALTNNRVHHAYLFSGPRGCGKTTSARILARALNCEKGPAAEPCGVCDSCRDLARGGPGSIDVIEIDAASHGGVDDARDLRERAFFAPVASRYKVYIVDEAHMVTTAGFNALLKLVEEPPPHVKFIFATTEPDKVIGTIRSRTHHYPFRLVPPRVLGAYLTTLCEAEGIAVEPAVLPLVVRAGAGSVRDSLSVLDQLLGAADAGEVSYAHAAALLGYTPDSLLDEVMDAFAAGDAGGVFACVDKVIEVGQDPRRFAEDLLRRLRDLLVVAAVPDALSSGLVDVAADQAQRLSSQAAALGPGELTRAAEVMAAGLTEMRGTTAPRLYLELMCARVLLPGADVDDRGVHARLDRLERRMGLLGRPEEPTSPSGPAEPSAGSTDPQVEPHTREPATRSEGDSQWRPPASGPHQQSPRSDPDQRLAESAPEGQPDAESAAARPAGAGSGGDPSWDAEPPAARPTPDPSTGGESPGPGPTRPALSTTDVRHLWPEVLEEVKRRRRFTWILLSQNASVAEVRDNTLLLAMGNLGARDSFAKGGSEDVLREALVVVLGADLKITTMVDPGGGGGRSALGGSGRPAAPSANAPSLSASSANAPSPAASATPTSSLAAPSSGTAPSSETAQPPPAPSPPADSPAGPPAEDGATSGGWPPAVTPPVTDPAVRQHARDQIRPTRQGARDQPAEEDPDAAADRDDSPVVEDTDSHAELLARHLGAEIIDEETR